jgi:hypothetical protein
VAIRGNTEATNGCDEYLDRFIEGYLIEDLRSMARTTRASTIRSVLTHVFGRDPRCNQ